MEVQQVPIRGGTRKCQTSVKSTSRGNRVYELGRVVGKFIGEAQERFTFKSFHHDFHQECSHRLVRAREGPFVIGAAGCIVETQNRIMRRAFGDSKCFRGRKVSSERANDVRVTCTDGSLCKFGASEWQFG